MALIRFGRSEMLAGTALANPTGTYNFFLQSVSLADTTGADVGTSANPLIVNSGGTGGTANQIQGNIASGATDSGFPVKIGGLYTAGSQPTFATGQRVNFSADNRGNLRVLPVLTVQGATNGFSNSIGYVARDADQGTLALAASAAHESNGSTWDLKRKPNIVSRIVSSAVTGSPTLVKSTAGDITTWWGQNGAVATYMQIYDSSTTPVVGTTTIKATYPIPASAAFSRDIPNGGLYCASGIGIAFTTDAAGTIAAAAAAVVSFALLAA